jgi:hypothetical protein
MPKKETTALKTHQKAWLLVEVAVLAALMGLFNFFPQKIGVLVSAQESGSFIPLIMPGFTRNLIGLNLWLGLALGLNLIVLINGRRTITMKWATIGLNFFGMAILGLILTTGPIVSLDGGWAAQQLAAGASIAWIERDLIPLLTLSITASLTMAILALFIATIKKLMQLLGDIRLAAAYD